MVVEVEGIDLVKTGRVCWWEKIGCGVVEVWV
jgi:hypothetical protein